MQTLDSLSRARLFNHKSEIDARRADRNHRHIDIADLGKDARRNPRRIAQSLADDRDNRAMSFDFNRAQLWDVKLWRRSKLVQQLPDKTIPESSWLY